MLVNFAKIIIIFAKIRSIFENIIVDIGIDIIVKIGDVIDRLVQVGDGRDGVPGAAMRAFLYTRSADLGLYLGIFVLIGWPMYKLGFRNLTTYDPVHGSHYLPVSDLYASHVKWSWYASLGVNLAFLALYVFLGVQFGWVFALKYIIAPYFIYAAWLTFVTYMQHVAPEVPVYDSGDWSGLKGALATVDRNSGPFNWLTHNTGNLHVIHHIFPTIPHYRLREATDAVRPILGDWYMKSDRFVLADFVRTLIGCHFVEHEDGKEVWKSAYPFAKNYSGPDESGREEVPAE